MRRKPDGAAALLIRLLNFSTAGGRTVSRMARGYSRAFSFAPLCMEALSPHEKPGETDSGLLLYSCFPPARVSETLDKHHTRCYHQPRNLAKIDKVCPGKSAFLRQFISHPYRLKRRRCK